MNLSESYINKSPLAPEDIEGIEYPTPRINLSTSEDIRREMARVYRDSRLNKIASNEGTKLVYMLSQILKAHEVFVLEKKVSELELIAPRGIRCG
jgi:hypothetical protein